jgi:predicted DNA-binding transcriptional regulator AlpA
VNPDILTTPEALAYLRISRALLFRLILRDARFPRPIRMGRRLLRWRRRELDAWMAKRQEAVA